MRKSSRAVVGAAVLSVFVFAVSSAPAEVAVWADGVSSTAASSSTGASSVAAGSSTTAVRSIAAASSIAKPPARINDVLQITRLRGAWTEAINTLDVDRLLGLYAPGAVLFPEGEPVRLGVGAIGSWHGRWSARADVHYTIEAADLRFDGNWAVEEWTAEVTITPRGAGVMAISGDPLQFCQHGVRVYRKNVWGKWRIDRETWSPVHPAATRYATQTDAA